MGGPISGEVVRKAMSVAVTFHLAALNPFQFLFLVTGLAGEGWASYGYH